MNDNFNVPAAPSCASRICLKDCGSYLVAVILTVAILVVALKLSQKDLTAPLSYHGDGIVHLVWIKAIKDHGWYLHNPNLGAPLGMEMHDFPLVESLHLLIVKLLFFLCSDAILVGNAFYVLTYPLTTVTSLFVFRRFGANNTIAVVGSLLYTFQSYHLFRGSGHLFLASYYILPLSVMVTLWVGLDRVRLFAGHRDAEASAGARSRRLRIAGCVLICLLQSSSSVYYAFFSCFLLIVAGVSASLDRRQWQPCLTAVVLVAVTFSGVLANLAPSLVYQRRHGANPAACDRSYIEAEMYGMKLSQLVLPVMGHHIPALREARAQYEGFGVLSNENHASSMGLFASMGFICLLVMLLKRSIDEPVLEALSRLNIFAFLLGTIGGIGVLFNMLVSPQIRGYNRVSIIIAFFGLLTGAILTQRLSEWMANRGRPAWLFAALMALVLSIGIYDQIPRGIANRGDWSAAYARWRHDKSYFNALTSALPEGAAIYQLPYMPFPGSPTIGTVTDYDHARGYLHTSRLRFSYGCMRSRAGDVWLKELCEKPMREQICSIAAAGFSGVYIDRRGYQDQGQELEGEIAAIVGSDPIVSEDRTMAFYSISDYAAKLKTTIAPEEWARLVKRNRPVADGANAASVLR